MPEFPVYQYVQYGAVSINDEEINEILEDWFGETGTLDLIPQDLLSKMQEDGAYLIQNKASGAVGMVTPESLVLNYEEPDEDEPGFRVLGSSLIAQIINRLADINTEDKSEEYMKGLTEATQAILDIQEKFND